MKYICFCLLLFSFASIAYSDDRPTNDFKMVLGASAFLDEEIPFDHFDIGASMRFGLTKRLSVEPQFLYLSGPGSDRDYTLTGNISYDLLTNSHFSVYVVCGGGLIRHTESFFQSGDFSVNDWTANGGIGARIHFTEQLFIAPEFRLGFEPLLTTQIGIGYSF
jgi:hypothetical protein